MLLKASWYFLERFEVTYHISPKLPVDYFKVTFLQPLTGSGFQHPRVCILFVGSSLGFQRLFVEYASKNYTQHGIYFKQGWIWNKVPILYWMIYLNTHTLLIRNCGRTWQTSLLPEITHDSVVSLVTAHLGADILCHLDLLVKASIDRRWRMRPALFVLFLSVSSLPPFNSFDFWILCPWDHIYVSFGAQ